MPAKNPYVDRYGSLNKLGLALLSTGGTPDERRQAWIDGWQSVINDLEILPADCSGSYTEALDIPVAEQRKAVKTVIRILKAKMKEARR